MADTIIVGGGICGLELGALLAMDGESVLVLEKLSHPGGRAFLWEKDGFTVDNGVHLVRFGPASATAAVFRRIGKPLDFADMGKSYVAFPDSRIVDFPTGPGGFLTTKLMPLRERLSALGLMIKVRRLPLETLLEVPLEKWMNDNHIGGGFRQYLHLVSASMQVCPFIDRSSTGEMLMNIKSVLTRRRSAMYPVQGWKFMYAALLETIGQKGEVRTGAEVKRLLTESGRATGVELASGETITAKRVIVNLPVQQLHKVVDDSILPADFAALCRNLRPTAGVVIDYGLSRRISEDKGLWYLWDPMSFGIFTSNLCSSVAPAGKQLLTWFAPADVEDMKDPAKAKALEEKLEAAIVRVFPVLPGAQQWRRAMHLAMVDGVEVNVKQHRHKRPGYRVPGIEGLFLVGDSLKGEGAGGDVGHESVLGAYAEITGRALKA